MPLTDFNRLRPPPRTVPFGLRVVLLFGGTKAAVGWVFVLTAPLWLFTAWHATEPVRDGLSVALGAGAVDYVEGRVHRVRERDERGDDHPFSVSVEYEVQGRTYVVIGHAPDPPPVLDDVFIVTYAIDGPSRATIDGLLPSDDADPPFVLGLLCLLVPILGVWLAVSRLRRGRREIECLHRGQAALARAIGWDTTRLVVDGMPELKITFEYTDEQGVRHTVEQITLHPEGLVDEPVELVLYLPERPGWAVLLDSQPEVIRVDDDGGLAPPTIRTAWAQLRVLAVAVFVVVVLAAAVAANIAAAGGMGP